MTSRTNGRRGRETTVRTRCLAASPVAIFAALAACLLPACGSDDSSVFDNVGTGADGSAPGDGAATDGGTSFDDGPVLGQLDACTNLACKQVACSDGGKTTVSGTVYDPAGKVPLYNVIVYVPNAPVLPLVSTGATCDKCGATVSGSPLVTTLTDARGHFVLDDVPAGSDIPLVMQVGKWRRQVVLPAVAPCTDTAVADRSLTRLPRNRAEGDIPRIALTTGGADPLECLLRKIGLDESEFGTAGLAGRAHLYAGGGYTNAQSVTQTGASKFAPGLNGGAPFASATTFWSSAASLAKYDIVLMACEGQTNDASKPAAARQALYDYENAGGRVFASHWHRVWFSGGPPPVPSVGTWMDRIDPAGPPPATATGIVDVSFPKGQALRDWLLAVSASTVAGQLPIKDSKHNVDAVDPARAQQWISLPNPSAGNQKAVEYMTFNTPIDALPASQCGRVVYSDLHVSSGDVVGQPFPQGCVTTDLSPQEKALEFMLFDLSSCVQSDSQPPAPPPR
jgi:hypothetical protein